MAQAEAGKRHEWPQLDGVRGLAMCAVVVYHCAVTLEMTSGRWYSPLIQELATAVPVFLALSGFLLFLPWARRHAGATDRSPSVGRYALRRVARVLPGYWVALPVATLVAGTAGSVFASPERALQIFFLGQNWSRDTVTAGLPQAWTIGTEAMFYVFLPLWVIWSVRGGAPGAPWVRRQLVALGALLVFGVVFKGVAIEISPPSVPSGAFSPLSLSLFGWIDFFVVGMLLAVLVAAVEARVLTLPGWLAWLAARPLLCMALAFVALLLGPEVRDAFVGVPGFVGNQELRAVAAGLILLPCVLGLAAGGRILGFLGHRRIRWLGTISYGAYLWHIAIVHQAAQSGQEQNALGFTFWVLVASFFAGAVSWYLIERPVLRWSARVGRRTPDVPATAVVPAP